MRDISKYFLLLCAVAEIPTPGVAAPVTTVTLSCSGNHCIRRDLISGSHHNLNPRSLHGDPLEGDPLESDPLESDPEEGDPEEGDPEEGDLEEDPEEQDPEQEDPEEEDPGDGDLEEDDPEKDQSQEVELLEFNVLEGDHIKLDLVENERLQFEILKAEPLEGDPHGDNLPVQATKGIGKVIVEIGKGLKNLFKGPGKDKGKKDPEPPKPSKQPQPPPSKSPEQPKTSQQPPPPPSKSPEPPKTSQQPPPPSKSPEQPSNRPESSKVSATPSSPPTTTSKPVSSPSSTVLATTTPKTLGSSTTRLSSSAASSSSRNSTSSATSSTRSSASATSSSSATTDVDCPQETGEKNKRCKTQEEPGDLENIDDREIETDEDARNIIKALKVRGQKSVKEFSDTIKNSQKNFDINFDEHYKDTPTKVEEAFDSKKPKWLEDISDLGPILTDDYEWTKQEVRNSKKAGGNSEDDPILSTSQQIDLKTIVVDESIVKGRDQLEDDSKKVARWSDMVMYTWKKTCDGDAEAYKSLKYVIHSNIKKNSAGFSVLESIFKLSDSKTTKDVEETKVESLEVAASSTGEELDFYLAFLGTIHGYQVNRMLGDYHEDLEELRIKTLHIFRTCNIDEAEDGESYYDVVIQLDKK
ncbi:hypothetical protein B0J11DRAFT_511850 [Dendryphion nanum]|uniref:Uncharacterized protein n=1 Tax=Dendryphion nanum TaxID=256645 RepID=A0A9P9IA85_9PLEO|nr:hypothetical protein B0J11DRAFT_511850 [Dendryphion nanum]